MITQQLTTKLYPNAKVRGPYLKKSTGRRNIEIVFPDGRVLGMLYSRFLYQEYLARFLTLDEEVDHIDDDKTNDIIENLQILTQAENARKAQQKYFSTFNEKCFWCENIVEMTAIKQSTRKLQLRTGSAGPFCSKTCVARYTNSQRRT